MEKRFFFNFIPIMDSRYFLFFNQICGGTIPLIPFGSAAFFPCFVPKFHP